MIKNLIFAFFCSLSLMIGNHSLSPRSSLSTNADLNLEVKENNHYKVIGVNDSSLSQIRIYYDDGQIIDEIAEGAFESCSQLQSLMISYCVTIMPTDIFSDPNNHQNFTDIYYTGTELEWQALDYSTNYRVTFEACDEGFIRLWNRDVRPFETSNVCDISKVKYDEIISLYEDLSEEDKAVVNDYEDLSGTTIADSLSFLKSHFSGSANAITETREVSSSTMISFILIIAVGGMTFIMVFYYLKDKKIIE